MLVCIILSPRASASYREESDLYYGTYTENFVIRWGFQSRCHHSFDLRVKVYPTDPTHVTTFDPSLVKPGDIIFVRNVPTFMKELHPHIKHPYIMVTAGECLDKMREKWIRFFDDKKIIAWFSIHACKKCHPKFHPIPLGILQKPEHYEKRTELTQFFAQLRQMPRNKLLCMNFRFSHKAMPQRDDIVALFENRPFCYKSSRRRFSDYMKGMAEFKFVLSPAGRGPDTYRTWEAMLAGTIPIVQTSQLDYLYAGLPVLIIKKWEDITPEFLEKKYRKMTAKKYNIKKLCVEYWWKKINRARERFLSLHTKKIDTFTEH